MLVACAGVAASTVVGVACVFDTDCSDGDPCNGIERCVAESCVLSAAPPCDDGDPCTLDQCIAETGCRYDETLCPSDCTGLSDGTRCADGTICTVGDSCSAGACVPGPPRNCPDEDECTSATCDPQLGCVYTEEFVSTPCVAECTGTVADYTRCPGDGDVCTIDACLPSVDFSQPKCVPALLLFRNCSDGNLCNGTEWCDSTRGCQSGPPLDCDDGDVCSGAETCDPATGCQPGIPLADGTPCDDGLLCTQGDVCGGGHCSGQPMSPADCDDGNAATSDQCREGFGCLGCTGAGVRRLRLRTADRGDNGRLQARGVWSLPAGASPAPASEDVTLIADADGAEVYRVTVAAGGLSRRRLGRYVMRDAKGANEGLRRLVLRIRSSGEVVWRATAAHLSWVL